MVWLISFCLGIFPLKAAAAEFRKETLRLAGHSLTVEIAESEDQHEQGLMFRKTLKDNEGMLFVFDHEQTLNFWMKNTLIDLAIGYFDKNRKLTDIQEMKAAPLEVRPIDYPSKSPSLYALEVPKGWFQRKNVRVGETFSLTKTPSTKSTRQKSSP